MEEKKETNKIEEKEEKAKKKGGFSEFIKKLKSIKHIELIVAIIFIVIALLLYFTISDVVDKGESPKEEEQTSLEMQVQSILSTIEGVGNSKVLITFKGSEKQVLAMQEETKTTSVTDSETNGNRTTTETVTEKTPIMVTINGVAQPVVLQTFRAEIDGIVIVADGGDNVLVKMKIVDAVCTLLNVDTAKIKIFKMSEKNK